jgi:small nuclear ribonucleoprotein (snRNP)-like protein
MRTEGVSCAGIQPRSNSGFSLVQVTVELKNDLAITGTLHSVDQYMNIKLDNVKVVNEDKFPHMVRHLPTLFFRPQSTRLHWPSLPSWL